MCKSRTIIKFSKLQRYQFWDKTIMNEIAEADDAARAVENLGKRVLEEYRRKHTEEELQEDKSILAHLIRRCVVICQHTNCSVLFC